VLWNRIINAIALDRVSIKNSEKFIDEFFDIIYPLDCQTSISLENLFKLREYTKQMEQKQDLFDNIYGENPLKFVKEDIVLENMTNVI